MKAIAANSCAKGETHEIFISWCMKQKIIGLIYHQQGADRNKQVAVNEKSKDAWDKSL